MIKKLIPAAVIAIIGITGLVIILRKPATKAPASSARADIIIHMTDQGFSPEKATIKQGQTIGFVNDGKDDRWPASNIHPTHEIYPQFDPKRPIAPNKSWNFTFD